MSATTVESTVFDGLPAWKLSSASGASAVVAERGATLISWEPQAGVNVIDGYVSRAELEDGEMRARKSWLHGQAD